MNEHYQNYVHAVTQLVEQPLQTTEVHGSNKVIGKIQPPTYAVNCIGNQKLKKKEARISLNMENDILSDGHSINLTPAHREKSIQGYSK